MERLVFVTAWGMVVAGGLAFWLLVYMGLSALAKYLGWT